MGALPEVIWPAKIRNARCVPGWMDEFELLWLADHAALARKIVEIGSWKGRSTTALAEHTPGVVFAVDTWLGSKEHSAELIGPRGQLFEAFRENTRGLPIIPVEMRSTEAARLFEAAGIHDLDMVFIDGSHEYLDVKADILAWQPLLAPDGLLCGHDYNFPDVAKAVHEILGDVKNPVVTIWSTGG